MVLPLLAPILGAAIGGGLSLIGGQQQNSAAAAAADKQMQFQENSARHSYQWATEDMKKAGINPLLAYKQGGSGTLSGSSYTPQNVGAAAASGASSGASSAIAASRAGAELENIKADTALKASQDKTQDALAIQALSAAGLSNASTAVQTQELHNRQLDADMLREALIQTMPKSTIAKFDQQFWSSPAAAPLLATRRLMEALNPGAAVANSAANLMRPGR